MKKIVYLLVGIFFFSFLPLAGWGLGDAAGFFADPFRLAFAVMMMPASLLVVLLVPREGRGYGEGEKPLRRQKLAIRFLQIAPLVLVLLCPFLDRHHLAVLGGGAAVRAAGVVLAGIGFFFMNWSVAVLGRHFSVDVTLQADHQLVTRGPYRRIRHPRYLGILLFFAGIALVFRSGPGLAVVLLTLAVLLWRIRDEEALLRRQFGAAWDEYRRSTRYLLPYLY